MELFSDCKTTSFQIDSILTLSNKPYYHVILLQGQYTITVELTTYKTQGFTVLFTTPYQVVEITPTQQGQSIEVLQFHADFYCIEYHKQEVACNGVLFNNIFVLPTLSISHTLFEDLQQILKRITHLLQQNSPYNQPIVKSLLQLLLAYCSKEKLHYLHHHYPRVDTHTPRLDFEKVLKQHFITHRQVRFYADLYNQSVPTFSKNIKKAYGKTPSLLIQEILILEAKKQLHLTRRSVKEIAHHLNFNDEFYFSRFFKKAVGVSPINFREKVGISIVAK